MATRRLRVGIVGCGSFARRAYALNLTDHPEAVIAALCDSDRTRAERLAGDLVDDYGVEPRPQVYEDYALPPTSP